jgi:SdrD B-like domain/Bacterial Ig domain
MKIRNLMLTLVLGSIFCIQSGYTQIDSVKYQIRYNTTTCRYDAYVVFTKGNATTAGQRIQFNAQYSLVIPTGTAITLAQNFMPLTGNSGLAGTVPLKWSVASIVSNPVTGKDYISITPTLSPTAHYNTIVQGDSVRIFSVTITPVNNCGENIRIYVNGVDPPSTDPNMSGGDFSNGFTIGGITQKYDRNITAKQPPKPVLNAVPTCSNGLEIDLAATTSACQTPLTYAWTGPNGFISTMQDVNIPNATVAANGTYMVTVTDSKGCSSTHNVIGTAKPSAGTNIPSACSGGNATLTGTSPTSGTWSASSTNPAGGTVGATSAGVANVSFNAVATGIYNFVYTSGPCSDTMSITVSTPDAGPDPSSVGCFTSGLASLSAVGTGVWSVDPSSVGTAIIANPNVGSTSVSGFSAPGTFTLNWTSNGCVDKVTFTVGSNCTCAIFNNSVGSLINPNFCNNTGPFFLDGQLAVPVGGTYAWEYSFNSGPYGPATGINNAEDYSNGGLPVGVHRLRRIYISIDGTTVCRDTSNVIVLSAAVIPSVPANLVAIPNPVCIGNVVNLSVTSVSGLTYNWTASSPNAGLGATTINTNTLTPTLPGTYVVSVTASANGCTSNPATVTVIAGETPHTPIQSEVTSTNPTVCATANGNITFAAFTPNTTYTLNYTKNGLPVTTTVTSNASGVITLSGLTAGTYANFIFSNSAGCASAANSVAVTLSDPSAPNAPTGLTAAPNPTCLGPVINLSVTNTVGSVYTWSVSSPLGGIATSTTNTNTMTPTASGGYTVSVTQTVGGCTSPPATIGITVNATPPTPSNPIGTNPTACNGTNGFITMSGYMASTTYSVMYSVTGSPVTLNITSNSSGALIIPNLGSASYSNFKVTNVTNCASGIFAGPVLLSDPNAPTPPANITATPNPSCLGQAVALNVTNNSGAVYVWTASSPNAGLGTSTNNTNSMTATSVGVYTISVTQNVAGCVSAPATILVNVQGIPPTPTAGTVIGVNPTACAGSNGSISLSGLLNLTTYIINYSKNGAPTTLTTVSTAGGVATIPNLTAGTYSNFSLVNTAGCASGVFAGPISLTDPGSPAAPTNLTAVPNPVCAGTTVNLSVTNTPGATYLWTASDPLAGLVASPGNSTTMIPQVIFSTGTYSISVTQTIGGCVSLPATITVNVNFTPSLSPGQLTSVSPTTCGGTNGSVSISGQEPNATYTLDYIHNGVPKVATIVANPLGVALLSNLSAGIYTGFRLTSSQGCISNTLGGSFTLTSPNAPPAPSNIVANPNPVCLNQIVNLSVTNNPGAVYTWSANSPNAGIIASTTNTTTMTATVAGNYTISVFQNVAGCISAASTVDVVINPNPPTPNAGNVTSVNPTCAELNGSISLSGLTPSTSYTLNFVAGSTPEVRTLTSNSTGVLTIINLAAGSYSNFRLTNAQGCSSGTYAGPVVLTSPGIPNPPSGLISSPDFICLKSIVNLQVSNITGAIFNWTASSLAAGLASTGTSNTNTLNPTLPGLYSISVTQSVNGCVSLPAVFSLEVRGDCYNPDIDVTWVGVSTEGSVKTNDGQTTSTYSPAVGFVSNPSTCLPIVAPDGTYTFICSMVGLYKFNVPACLNASPSSCENIVLQITVLDFVPNNPPVVNHDYMRTKSNTPIVITALANDKCESFPNCNLDNFAVLVNPVNGTFNAITGLYTPNSGFIGKDSIRYRVCQMPTVTPVNCNDANIYITVIGAGNVNITNSMDDYNQTGFNTTLTVNGANGLKLNDKDPESNTQNIAPVSQTISGKGSINIAADGSYTFIPETGFSGPVFIPYEICDLGSPVDCDKATLHILVERYNPVASVGDFVWHDMNGDGIQGSSEPGIPGAQVSLYDLDDYLIVSTTTNATGKYQFDNVVAGTYYMKFKPSANFSFTEYGKGNDITKDSDVTNKNGAGTTNYFTLLPGQQKLDVDAGVYICSKIGDRVWYDTDKDDIWDLSENGINGIVVNLYRKYGSQWIFEETTFTKHKPLTTSDDGYYEFCVKPGEYYVQFVVPSIGLVPVLPNKGNNSFLDSDITGTFGTGTTRSFMLLSGQNKLDIAAGYYPMATAGNLVWKDENVNGIQESFEPRVANVVVEAFDANTHEKISEATTDNNGAYNLNYLQKKEIYLKFNLPNGLGATLPLATTDEMDSDIDHTYGLNTTRKVMLEPGKKFLNFDAGLSFAPLPIDFLDVNVVKSKNDHLVTWATSRETNSAYFEVERSINNPNNFKTVSAKIPAAGNSSDKKNYSFLDDDITEFGTYYYRINEFDLDGKSMYSKVVSIRNGGKNKISLYPSPTVSDAHIDLVFQTTSKVKIELFDASSKLIAVPLSDRILEDGEHNVPINMNDFANGVYVVSITIDGEITQLKLIKVD